MGRGIVPAFDPLQVPACNEERRTAVRICKRERRAAGKDVGICPSPQNACKTNPLHVHAHSCQSLNNPCTYVQAHALGYRQG